MKSYHEPIKKIRKKSILIHNIEILFFCFFAQELNLKMKLLCPLKMYTNLPYRDSFFNWKNYNPFNNQRYHFRCKDVDSFQGVFIEIIT